MSAPVLLATWSGMPAGEEWTGTTHLMDAFTARGLDARWVVWDDPSVDWSEGLVAVRSTWDYEGRLPEFLAWARSLPWLLNSADVFAWNTDKAYLPVLAARGVPVVPTVTVDRHEELAAAVEAHPEVVLKPRVGAGGRGVLHGDAATVLAGDPGPGPWVVQPLVGSVRTQGETSVFVLDGHLVAQAQKVPATGEIRVHEQYGGSTVGVPLTEEACDVARSAVAAAEELLGERLDYARVDQMRLADGSLAVSELELTEPGLYLEVLPGNAEAFVDLVVARLRSRAG